MNSETENENKINWVLKCFGEHIYLALFATTQIRKKDLSAKVVHDQSICEFVFPAEPSGNIFWAIWIIKSVTRLGDLLYFEQLFKAFGNN